MTDIDDVTRDDISWEEFFGSSPDLMPSIMGAFDAYLNQKKKHNDATSTPKRSQQLGNFATNLSPCVQKILSHVPEEEVQRKANNRRHSSNRACYRNLSRNNAGSNKTNEILDIISPGVSKMLSNLQDSELVRGTSNLHVKNHSYLFTRSDSERFRSYNSNNSDRDVNGNDSGGGSDNNNSEQESYVPMPLGSYLHSDKGIASRTPVGRKNVGKYLQVPSETSTGLTNSTLSSSEASWPVSITSLGSCSSSGSSSNGQLNQPESSYLASAESLDSDPEPAGSQGSADSGIAEPEQMAVSPEQRVLQEVLDTETTYVADLEEVIQGYLNSWRSDSECPLNDHLSDLFTNLEEIHEFNRKILEDLSKAISDPTQTANVFIQHDKGFQVYNEYCARYPRTMEALSALQRDQKMSSLIKERQLDLGHALPLGSYLLKPVQRILKYHLLLQRLSKLCDSQHKSTVDLALATMTSVAADINNMKRKHEHAVRVQEIQSQLYGWMGADLTTLGELIAEGTFRMQGAKGRRHVFLFEKVLLLAKSKSEGALAYKTHIECSNLMLVEQVRGDSLSFQVLPFDNPRLQCTLRARSPHHKREWTLQIKRVLLENFSAVIPSHARQLVMQLGEEIPHDSEETSERWSPLKHNSITPHYLEKRSRVKKTRERSVSQDRSFTSFGSWRRKSDPSMIPQQYDSKVVPKKISKLKKSKEINGSSTFYTDLSDSENCCDLTADSVECLVKEEEELQMPVEEQPEIGPNSIGTNLEKIVSELIMQNQDFHKVFNRTSLQNQRHPRRNITSEPGPIWYEESRPQLPSKADSLPRSFQLNNDPSGNPDEEKGEAQAPRQSDLSSRLDETDHHHPEYKIYRKTPMRLSMLQRIRMILSEEQRRTHSKPSCFKGSKNTGEKLAHPDYVDPQILFTRNNSQASLSLDSGNFDQDVLGERVQLDMSLNGKEVLKEIDKRLMNSEGDDDSYYESILDNSLTEEYVRDATGKLVAKSDSFTNHDRAMKIVPPRPSGAPPPVPMKPLRLTNRHVNSRPTIGKSLQEVAATQNSWVKAMVGRYSNEQ